MFHDKPTGPEGLWRQKVTSSSPPPPTPPLHDPFACRGPGRNVDISKLFMTSWRAHKTVMERADPVFFELDCVSSFAALHKVERIMVAAKIGRKGKID